MNKIKLTYFSDPSHGWLSVKRSFLEELGILNKITSCSYQKGKSVYLECDQDVSTFVEAVKEKYKIQELKDLFEIKESWTNGLSPIRKYARFNKNAVKDWKVGISFNLYGKKYKVVTADNNKITAQCVDSSIIYQLKKSQKDDAFYA